MRDFIPIWFVIPNWNLRDDLLECLHSITRVKDELSNFEIVVVDNGSTDGSPEAVEEIFNGKVYVLRITENKGFAYASNQGIKFALARGAASIFLLNNDTIVLEGTVSKLLEVASSGVADIVSPSIYYASHPERLWRFGDRRVKVLGGLPLPVYPRSSEIIQLDYVTGCAMLVHSSVFERIGFFDEQFFMYYEDADFCHRATNSGYRIVGVPGAKVLHKVSRSSVRRPEDALYWRTFGLVRFAKKHFGDFSPFFILAFVTLKLLQMFFRSYEKSGLTGLKGVWIGIHQALTRL